MFPAMVLSCMLQKDHFCSLTYCPAKPPSTQQMSPIRSGAFYVHSQHSMRRLEQKFGNLKCIWPRSRVYLACHLILGGLSQEFDVIHFAIRVEGVHEDAEAPAQCGLLVIKLGEDAILGLRLQCTRVVLVTCLHIRGVIRTAYSQLCPWTSTYADQTMCVQ